ncbi:hypothetical protein Hanom_Chr12g01159311 [Helianthus anomalus]
MTQDRCVWRPVFCLFLFQRCLWRWRRRWQIHVVEGDQICRMLCSGGQKVRPTCCSARFGCQGSSE